jgi:hypothetical protein
MNPVFCGKIIEGEKHVLVFFKACNCLGIFVLIHAHKVIIGSQANCLPSAVADVPLPSIACSLAVYQEC